MPYDPYSGCYYQDPNGLPGYDAWKLASPYDDYEEGPECEHEDYEIDWEGRAHCEDCDETWWASASEVKAREASERRIEREISRNNSWYMRAWRWAVDRLALNRRAVIDDEIPF